MEAGVVSRSSFDRLRVHSIGLPQVLFQSITHMAPAAAVAYSLYISVPDSQQALALSVLLAGAAMACAGDLPKRPQESAHPHYNDRGTLSWSRNLASAQAAARASDKLIFIEYGREHCGNCKALVQNVLPDPRIRQQLSAISSWPTIPQLFVDGELIGGCDIVTEMYESGELAETLR